MNEFSRALFMRQVLPWVLVLLVTVGGSAFGYMWLDDQLQQAQRTLMQKKRQYQGLYSDVQFLMEQYSLQEKYGAQFWALRQQGLVSQVKRDRWVDALLLFSEAYGFSNYTHVFQPAIASDNRKLGTVVLDRSIFHFNPVVTQASMPLDIDFIRFYRYFKQAVTPYAMIKGCQFSHAPTDSKRKTSRARIRQVEDLKHKPFDVPFKMRCEWVVFTAEPRKRQRR